MKSLMSLVILGMTFSSTALMAVDTECGNLKKSGDLVVAYEKIKSSGKKQTYQNIDLDAFFKSTNKERMDFINTTCDVGMDFYEIAAESRSLCYNSCYKESFKISHERAKSWGFIKACGEVCDGANTALKASIKNSDVVQNKKPNVVDTKRQAKEMQDIEDMIYQAPAKKVQGK